MNKTFINSALEVKKKLFEKFWRKHIIIIKCTPKLSAICLKNFLEETVIIILFLIVMHYYSYREGEWDISHQLFITISGSICSLRSSDIRKKTWCSELSEREFGMTKINQKLKNRVSVMKVVQKIVTNSDSFF